MGVRESLEKRRLGARLLQIVAIVALLLRPTISVEMLSFGKKSATTGEGGSVATPKITNHTYVCVGCSSLRKIAIFFFHSKYN